MIEWVYVTDLLTYKYPHQQNKNGLAANCLKLFQVWNLKVNFLPPASDYIILSMKQENISTICPAYNQLDKYHC